MIKITRFAIYSFLLPGFLLLLVAGCSKSSDPTPEPASTPVVTTAAVTAITMTTANSGGNVTSPGGSIVTEWGICWSKSANPTVSDSKCGGGATTSNYTCGMTGLDVNTLYYVRAYAKNSYGISYGDQKSFTTLAFTHPVFTVRSQINTSSFSLTFYGTCTNDDVKMTKVLITDPENVSTYTYEMNESTFGKNIEFNLQAAGDTYPWLTGHWTLEFIGTRVVNGESFDVVVSKFV